MAPLNQLATGDLDAYLTELWAARCTAARYAMPHLSQLTSMYREVLMVLHARDPARYRDPSTLNFKDMKK